MLDILTIVVGDDRAMMKAKFGTFRMKWITSRLAKKDTDFSEEQMDKIAGVFSNIIGRGTAEEDRHNSELINSIENAVEIDQ